MDCGSIKMCAISADSMYLAFITRESKQGLSRFRVHLFEKDDLHRTGVSAGNSKLEQGSSKIHECVKAVRLQFSPDRRFLHAVFTLNPGEICGAKSLIWEIDTGRVVDIRNIIEPVSLAECLHFRYS